MVRLKGLWGVYEDGADGVPANATAALYWYKRAAELKHSGAMFNLGAFYFNTDGYKNLKIMPGFSKW